MTRASFLFRTFSQAVSNRSSRNKESVGGMVWHRVLQVSTLMFRVSRDIARPQSLASRVVACFHDLPLMSSETFTERATMRAALRDAVLQA